MYSDSARWHGIKQDYKNTKVPLFVVSCGTYRLMNRQVLPTHYKRGRLDFQLLYVASGQTHFYFNNVEHIVTAGHMVLYRPKEEQRYYYYSSESPEVFWVHFSGNDVTNILRRYGFADNAHVICSGISLDYKRIFQRMIQELKLEKDFFEDLLADYLKMLFIAIHRVQSKNSAPNKRPVIDCFDDAVQFFHEHYTEQIVIKNYAVSKGMSVSWFIRGFHEYTGFTPAQYLLSLRISNAQDLIEQTSYNMSEIANIVGYDNPLYFSRLFKKQTGIPPREYRKQCGQSADAEKRNDYK